MEDSIRIETERLLLRRMQETDVSDLIEYDSHPELNVLRNREPFTEDRALDFLGVQSRLALGTQWERYHIAVVLKSENKMIGHVCIKILDVKNRQGEVGWFFNPNYQRRGFATEASGALIDFGFKTMGLHRITAQCDVLNERSFSLMERLGTRREAHYLEKTLIKGEWHDQYAYAILEQEWDRLSG